MRRRPVAELITERIRRHASELGLHGIAEDPDEPIERAEAERLGYREFLDLVLESEVGVLEGRRYQARLKMAGLPHHKTLDEFDVAFQSELDPKRLAELRTLRFVERKVGCLILGPPGVGKNHISVAWRWRRSPAATSPATPRSTTSSADCAEPTRSQSSRTSWPSSSVRIC
jgi:DNA replication protein DnaC